MYLGQNIKYLRKKENLTLTGLGDQLGKNAVTVSDYEKGKTLPPLDILLKLSEVFNISLDDLVKKDLHRENYFPVEKNDSDPEKDELLSRINALLENRVKTLESVIKTRVPELAKELGF